MFTRLISTIALLWAGMIIGISFLESWVKFRAPSLTREIGLDVGRTVFKFFHHVQNVLLLLIIGLSVFAKFPLIDWLLLLGLTIILSMQLFWLFPQLNRRADAIIAGINPSSSHIHTFYGVTEILKWCILVTLALN